MYAIRSYYEFHERFWKGELIDFVILQQDAFDKIDCSTPLVRQEYLLKSVLDVADTSFEFKGFEDVSTFFKNVINQFKQLNYSEYESDQFNGYVKAIDELVQAQKK